MLEIEFITANKPDAKKAAKILGPMLYEMLEQKRLAEQAPTSRRKLKQPSQLDSGDSVA